MNSTIIYWTKKPRTSDKDNFCTIKNVLGFIWVCSHIRVRKSNNNYMRANPYDSVSAVTIYICKKISVNITKNNKREALYTKRKESHNGHTYAV